MENLIMWICVALLAVFCFICTKAKRKSFCDAYVAKKESDIANVLAEFNGGLIVSCSSSNVMCFVPQEYREQASVGCEVMVKDLPNPDGGEIFPIAIPLYAAGKAGEGTKLAEIVCRLDDDLVACRFKGQDIIVKCSPEEQEQKQTSVSLVVGIGGDENFQTLKCRDVMELPFFENSDEDLSLAQCYVCK